MSINTTTERYYNGDDHGLRIADQSHTAMMDAMRSGKTPANWPALNESQHRLTLAALRAGYRMALDDIRADLVREGTVSLSPGDRTGAT